MNRKSNILLVSLVLTLSCMGVGSTMADGGRGHAKRGGSDIAKIVAQIEAAGAYCRQAKSIAERYNSYFRRQSLVGWEIAKDRHTSTRFRELEYHANGCDEARLEALTESAEAVFQAMASGGT